MLPLMHHNTTSKTLTSPKVSVNTDYGILFNENTFYPAFIRDILKAEKEVVIYCPFLSKFRSEYFNSTLSKLQNKNIPVFIFTRPLEEHERLMRYEISCAIDEYEELGVNICYLEGLIHEKVAIIDRKILWEGSLNILSQRSSHEMMRRIDNEDLTAQMVSYLRLNKKLILGHRLFRERLREGLTGKSKRKFKFNFGKLLTGVIIPFFKWWIFTIFKVMILSLRGLVSIMSAIKFIFN